MEMFYLIDLETFQESGHPFHGGVRIEACFHILLPVSYMPNCLHILLCFLELWLVGSQVHLGVYAGGGTEAHVGDPMYLTQAQKNHFHL